MNFDKLRLILKAVAFFVPFAGEIFLERIAALYHRRIYRAEPGARTVLVIGGSFAGLELVKRLSETLPTGYTCVLLESNSHFNYSFNFPRFSVIEGHERAAFIPYDGIERSAPEGAFSRVQDTAVDLTETHAVLASGDKIPYHILVIATGSTQSLPAKVHSTDRDQACLELQSVQRAVRNAQTIAIVGAGAVGVEMASDIADFYPEKSVTLIHSRGRLLNHFGKRLHNYVLAALQKLEVRILFKERPNLPPGSNLHHDTYLKFSDGHTERFDLVINCTGQRPNSALIRSLYPECISSTTSRILVTPTLQLLLSSNERSTKGSTNVFAFGDVAEHHGPRMARAAFFQSRVVLENVLALAHGKAPRRTYAPRWDFEAAIKLTLGRDHHVLYCMEPSHSLFGIIDEAGKRHDSGLDDTTSSSEKDLLVVSHRANIDLDIQRAWRQNGVDFKMSQIRAET